MQIETHVVPNKSDRVRFVDYGTGIPVEMTIAEFIAANFEDFEDKTLGYDFFSDLAEHGEFHFPASMETLLISLVR